MDLDTRIKTYGSMDLTISTRDVSLLSRGLQRDRTGTFLCTSCELPAAKIESRSWISDLSHPYKDAHFSISARVSTRG